MSILESLKNKAAALWDGGAILNRPSSIYDASLNSVIVAGLKLDGVVTTTLSEQAISRSEFGIHSSYYTYYDINEIRTLTVELLPTAKSVPLMEKLALSQKAKAGWFTIDIYDNGLIQNRMKAHIISHGGLSQSDEGANRVVIFGVIPLAVVANERFAQEGDFETPVAIDPSEIEQALPSVDESAEVSREP